MAGPGNARWRFWHNYLVGIPWERWRALRAANRVDAGFRHRAAYLTALSVRNSLYRRIEERRYGAAVAATQIAEAPLFILGHWRAGTTLLHNLLACDTEQFAFPNSIQASYPYTFLCTEAAVRRQFAALVPRTRMMDAMEMGPATPQEDEWALCVASLKSPCIGMFSFPRRMEQYDRYLTFRDVPEPEVEEWRGALLWFLRKLTMKHRRPLLLKSPAHTARIGRLLKLFPRARFVHIHRDPYAVFQSTEHLLQRLQALNGLQQPPECLDDAILRRYTQMYDAFFEERDRIPEGQFHEVAFADLEEDPIGQVRTIYERLGLAGFDALRPRLEEYVASLDGYRKNRFAELSPERRARIASAWQRSFELWGYEA